MVRSIDAQQTIDQPMSSESNRHHEKWEVQAFGGKTVGVIKLIATFIVTFIFAATISANAFGDSALLDSDFSKTATDKLPAGWRDASINQGKASVQSVHDSDGKAFLRIDSISDRATIACTIPADADNKQPTFERLSIEARDPSRNAVGLSLRGADSKKTFWHAVMLPDETWQTQTYLFEVEPHDEALNLQILVSRSGAIDLAHIKIQRESRDDLIAKFKADHPDGGQTTNLLRISRFPLGPQSGWGLDRDHSNLQMTLIPDGQIRGPSGVPSLKIIAWNGSPVRTEIAPFDIPWPFMPHTASLYARGRGHVSLVVLADGKYISSGELDVDDTWKRVTTTFNPPMPVETNQLQVVVSGTVWIDAAQVEPGDKATDYRSAKTCEVSLGLPKSEVAASRIQFADEPALMDYVVSGSPPAGTVLKAKVVNLKNEEKPLPDVALDGRQMHRGQFQIDVFPDRPFGQFRVETHIEDASGKPISTFNELIVTRLRRPRHWGEDAPNSPFGTHMNAIERQLSFAKAIGVNWTRLHDAGGEYIDWSSLEPAKGTWAFRDDAIDRYRAGHIEIFARLAASPTWATGVPNRPTGMDYWDRWIEPNNVADYADYVKAVTTHYKDSILAFDAWNEPWGKFWSKWDAQKQQSYRSPTAAEDFAKLQAAGYAAGKSADPNFKFVGINTMGGNVGPKWTGGVADAGGLATCDAYDYHFYNTEQNGWPGDGVDRTFHESWDSAIAKLKADGFHPASTTQPVDALDKPVWMTEGNGANRFITRGFYHYTLPPTVPQEDFIQTADFQSRYMTRLLSIGVKKIFLYHMNVGGEFSAGGGDFQSLVTDDGFAHPQAAAHSALAWELEDTTFAKHLDLTGGIHAWLFAGKDRSVAVILSEPKHRAYSPPHPTGGAVHDLFGNDLKAGEAFSGTTVYVDSPGDADALSRVLTDLGK